MFSPATEKALRAAIEAHEGQFRKGPEDVPYAVHPVHVALMLAGLGMDDAVVQAGILHDVVEDCHDWDLERLEEQFGRRVARIVAELTEDKSKSWAERKQYAIDHLPQISTDAAVVKAVDKLHNLESLRTVLQAAPDPEVIWKRFHGGRDRTMEMSERLVEAVEKRVPPKIGRALRKSLESLRSVVDSQSAEATTAE